MCGRWLATADHTEAVKLCFKMYSVVRAAEADWQGGVAAVRDYELVFNGAREPASHANGLVVGKSTLGSADPPLGGIRLPRHGHPTLAAEAHSSPPGGVGERGESGVDSCG